MDLISWQFLGGDLLSPISTIMLIVVAGFTSMISAAFGAGGGLMLLVIMASMPSYECGYSCPWVSAVRL